LRARFVTTQHRPGFLRTYFEEQPGAAGQETGQNLICRMAGLPVRADRVSGDKQVRAEPFADAARGGLVRIVGGAWAAADLSELAAFPRGRSEDPLDSTSGAFNRLAQAGGGAATGHPSETITGDMMNMQF
jgi:predicted phage terminase large subunit-like protein